MCVLSMSGRAHLKSLRTVRHRALCAALREARTAAGLTQRKLAERMKRSRSFVGKTECGERRLDVVEFIWYARALPADPLKLFAKVLG